MAALFIYGMGRFPDGPIHKCVVSRGYAIIQHPSGYCGKQGQPHTAEDYRIFEVWEETLFVTWPIGLAALFALRKMQQKRRSEAEDSN